MAVINYIPGHYFTYVRRIITNRWELHNDINKKITVLKNSSVMVHPHLIIYIRN